MLVSPILTMPKMSSTGSTGSTHAAFLAAFAVLCCLMGPSNSSLINTAEPINDRPIIGVLTQKISYRLNIEYPDKYETYIAASYVKFLEGAGARVVPIWVGQDNSYYVNIVNSINGMLWPGGSTYFNESNGYADAGRKIYRIAKIINERGDYFPILGICLGFELLTYVAANGTEHRENCYSMSQPIPLEFKTDYKRSRLFKNVPIDVREILARENVTVNFHKYCVTEPGLTRVGLKNQFRVMSTNHDVNGKKFISTLEHKSLPFYGLQFHPEKNLYEWITGKNIPHKSHAIRASQYFADFFVNEARKSRHEFPSKEIEAEQLIYKYPVTYTGKGRSSFVQCYMFTANDPEHSEILRLLH